VAAIVEQTSTVPYKTQVAAASTDLISLALLEVKDRANYVGDLAHMADGVQDIELRIRVDGVHRRFDDPGATAFTLIPRFAYSIASDLVAAARPPFVRDASTEGTPAIA